jgi:hypothetical protein
MGNQLLDMDGTQALAEQLKRIPRITESVRRRGERSIDAEAWQIATALADIEESAATLFTELVPKLLTVPPESEEAEDLLTDIGEEYRHILYHIRDTTLFDYLFEKQ